MSGWVEQGNGVKVRRVYGGYDILYPDGMLINKGCDAIEITHLIHSQPKPIKYENQPLSFTIPGKPPTSNNAYIDTIRKRTAGHPYVRRVLSCVAGKYKTLVKNIVADRRIPARRYQVTLTVYADWDTKTPKAKSPVKGSDIASCEKLLMDALFDTLMPDEDRADKWIWSMTMNKIHEPDKAKHRAVVTIRPKEEE